MEVLRKTGLYVTLNGIGSLHFIPQRGTWTLEGYPGHNLRAAVVDKFKSEVVEAIKSLRSHDKADLGCTYSRPILGFKVTRYAEADRLLYKVDTHQTVEVINYILVKLFRRIKQALKAATEGTATPAFKRVSFDDRMAAVATGLPFVWMITTSRGVPAWTCGNEEDAREYLIATGFSGDKQTQLAWMKKATIHYQTALENHVAQQNEQEDSDLTQALITEHITTTKQTKQNAPAKSTSKKEKTMKNATTNTTKTATKNTKKEAPAKAKPSKLVPSKKLKPATKKPADKKAPKLVRTVEPLTANRINWKEASPAQLKDLATRNPKPLVTQANALIKATRGKLNVTKFKKCAAKDYNYFGTHDVSESNLRRFIYLVSTSRDLLVK